MGQWKMDRMISVALFALVLFSGVSGYKMITCQLHCKNSLTSSFVLSQFQIMKDLSPHESCSLPSIVRSPRSDDEALVICNPLGSSVGIQKALDLKTWRPVGGASPNHPVVWDEAIGTEKIVSMADPRIFVFNSQYFLIFYKRHPQMQLARLKVLADGSVLGLSDSYIFIHHRFKHKSTSEKNWGPFEYRPNRTVSFDGAHAHARPQLLFVYSMVPHVIIGFGNDGSDGPDMIRFSRPPGHLSMMPLHCTRTNVSFWQWGEQLRGGTPAVYIPRVGKYLSFFHSKNVHNEAIHTYFMGAYMYEGNPPFAITDLSEEPIFAPNFHIGRYAYKHVDYINYPMSFILTENDVVLLSYGRQDTESWVLEIDLATLLSSLRPIVSHAIPCNETY
mgnify:FL=1